MNLKIWSQSDFPTCAREIDKLKHFISLFDCSNKTQSSIDLGTLCEFNIKSCVKFRKKFETRDSDESGFSRDSGESGEPGKSGEFGDSS